MSPYRHFSDGSEGLTCGHRTESRFELSHDARLRAMRPVEAAVEWLKPVVSRDGLIGQI